MSDTPWRVGDLLHGVEVGPIAHGGHWVARHDGRVIFVRHALEGEIVDVRVTGLARRHAFGDAVTITRPSADRVPEPCPVATVCGGCDFQHVRVPHQRELKRQVVAEQVRRLAGVEWEGQVEAVHPDDARWRTRMRYHRDENTTPSEWGLRQSRSHDIVSLPEQGCLIAAAPLARVPANAPEGPAVMGALEGAEAVWVAPGDPRLIEVSAAHRRWSVRADGFWQVHPQAADTLVEAVLSGLHPQPGETALDLYCGVGLFAGALVNADVSVTGIEGSTTAVAQARRNVAGARFLAGDVARVLGPRDGRRRQGSPVPGRTDLVVLDPPRAGAGAAVMAQVMARAPRAVAYVACDPAALARDLATAAQGGYRVVSLRAFDLFPQTHHVECVAIVMPE